MIRLDFHIRYISMDIMLHDFCPIQKRDIFSCDLFEYVQEQNLLFKDGCRMRCELNGRKDHFLLIFGNGYHVRYITT